MFDFASEFTAQYIETPPAFDVCGLATRAGLLYPLGWDTKVLAAMFEALTRPLLRALAERHDFELLEPASQNHYPDFTLARGPGCARKIAVDVKSTYCARLDEPVRFTLGSYTSFLRPGREHKNILYPYPEYAEHWVVGYVYRRAELPVQGQVLTLAQADGMSSPIRDVRVFVRRKWEVAGDAPGSGNTANIGSRDGGFRELERGPALFADEAEFLDYWRHYERDRVLRIERYSNLAQYRAWRESQALKAA